MARAANAAWLIPSTGNPFPVEARIGLAVATTVCRSNPFLVADPEPEVEKVDGETIGEEVE